MLWVRHWHQWIASTKWVYDPGIARTIIAGHLFGLVASIGPLSLYPDFKDIFKLCLNDVYFKEFIHACWHVISYLFMVSFVTIVLTQRLLPDYTQVTPSSSVTLILHDW